MTYVISMVPPWISAMSVCTRAYQYSDQGENVISDESERRALMQYFIRNGQILMQITMQMPYRVMNRSA